MTPIERIREIIDIYDGNFDGISLDYLMGLKTELAVLIWRFAEEVGTARGDSVIATVTRKYHHHKLKSQLIDQGYGVGYSESKSLERTYDVMMDEAQKEKIDYTMKLLLDAADSIMMDMTQRISVLKKEYEHAQQAD